MNKDYRRRKKGVSNTQIIIVVVVVLIIVIGVGVYLLMGRSSSSSPSTTTNTSSSMSSSSSSGGVSSTTSQTPVTITVWDTYSPSEDKAFNQTLAAFEQQYPWIHVQVTYGVSVATSNFASAAKAGQAPIVYRDTSDDAGKLFAAGLLLDLSQYLNSSVFSQYLPIAINNFNLSGKIYGLPDNVNYIVMFYNKKYVPYPPNTTAQLVNIALNVNKTYNVWGIAYGMGQEYGYRFAAWFAGFGGQMFNSQGIPQLNSTAMVNALQFWYNLTYVMGVNPQGISTTLEQQLFTSGKAAIIFDGPWDLQKYVSALGSDLGAAPLPIVSQTGLRAAPFIGSTGWVISSPQASGATPQQIQAALLFIQFVTGYKAEMNLWNIAGDIPAYLASYNQALTQLKAGNITPSYLGSIMAGIFEQANYGQKFPNIPQMSFYWNTFHEYVTEYYAGQITAQQAAQEMESTMIQQMQANGYYPDFILAIPDVMY
ncbi:extracellular solute-binding protein [Sulfolobus acidocaldarius]|uniref:Sugar-binding periplasmic protein n=4 Tax=Sulfolobus acidocaldarius TaxID=2285 RepID=Q4J9L8_SULAC|nr:extracellular solute-binding protein [Sulfolobus acidocaldarius]AAY80512.1 sugar-binding periplasmic protein [Sulfolobus acidocaldarius DSM 639]AGE71101.1 sugar-binding periplasmic protein [Sulfolobus acidocaldarius N8]AGE73372.1 sugar-binding periplasmic protein [Sulfolobus acidocaldarius Ron12/I]ALU28623.1 sugar ABC transporter substrate-binding protein [Sulfolobus acidocaldarius]ALU31338.1 sugar ABC transporter substrate-binding protein [Sulfolobus acidocaldarius]